MAAIFCADVCNKGISRMTNSRTSHLRRWLASAASLRFVSRCGGPMASWQKSIRLTARPNLVATAE